MLQQQLTYIYSIEGKDLYDKVFEIKENKKFKAALDYSLEAAQIETVANAVYKNKKDRESIFYQKKEKQYTDKVINLTFKYNVKEYNLATVKDERYYVYYKSGIDNKLVANMKFANGIYTEEDALKKKTIKAIHIGSETDLKSKDLPKGFGVKDKKIYLTSTGIKTIFNSDEIRRKMYVDGFKVIVNKKEVEYVRFKRSSGSSRVGKCLFIDKRLYGDMLKWAMMGLEFEPEEEIDLAAIEAYISLTTSSIIDTIEIDPKNILLIDDYNSEFEDTVMATEIIKENFINDEGEVEKRDRLFTSPKTIKISNKIWDGQCLLDISLFKGKYFGKGFMLIRNRFVKSAGFNSNIQQFFKDNNITSISQLNGRTLAKDIKDIKMITTPSSIKYLKFGTWDDFIKNCSSAWGVVKYDKPTHYFNGKMVQTHYQLLNTLQLNKTETEEFLKDSLDYVKLLKTDIRVFRENLHIKINNNIKYGDMNSTNEFIMTMLQLSDKFENTNLFNTFRQDSIKSYIRNMKKGHILINGNYSVLCGNGIEMLQATIKDKEHENAFNGKSLLSIDEVYCKNFGYGKELIGSRSPHVTIANIWICKNTNESNSVLINKYFNSSKQIIYVNSIKNNILERLSSADFDSDQLLLSDNKLLIEKAKQNYNNFLVPTNMVEAEKVPRLNTPEQKCDLDIKTSKNLIGEIINCSQILNSMLWDMLNDGKKCDDEIIQQLYASISQLDVMSCIEIDKAKKEFSINNLLELNTIREKYINKNKKPMFFKFLSREKGNKVKAINYRKYKTTMDYLETVIDKGTKEVRQKYRKGENKIVTFGELFSTDNVISLNGVSSTKANKIIKESSRVRASIIGIWNSSELTGTEKYNLVCEEKKDFIKYTKGLELTCKDIKKVIYNLHQESKKIKNGVMVTTELSKSARNLLSTLYVSYKEDFVKLFEAEKEYVEILKECRGKDEAKFKLYGINYAIINKKQLNPSLFVF